MHTHLLRGPDDGPETIEESLKLAAAMVAEGVTVAACTPHVRDDYATTPEAMEAALGLLQLELQASGIPLQAFGGGEIALERLADLDEVARGRFGLGGNPRLLLLEFPYFGWPLALPSLVTELEANSVKAVIAHPERSAEVQDQPVLLQPLVEAGAYIQVTAGSLDGSAGPAAARCARSLVEQGLAHSVAADSHGRAIRRTGLGTVRDVLRDDALAAWLTEKCRPRCSPDRRRRRGRSTGPGGGRPAPFR